MESGIDLVFGTYPSWSRLVVRVVLGIIFVAHGAQKVLGWFGGGGLKGTIAYFQKNLGVPPPAGAIAAFIEFLGGIALILGFLARPAALGILVVMLVAMKIVHAKHGFFLNASMTPGKGHGIEFTLALAAMALSIVIGGAGSLSIDALIASR